MEEPSAGMPVLEVLRGAGLRLLRCHATLAERTVLVRAYTAATQEALAAAQEASAVQEMHCRLRWSCRPRITCMSRFNAWSPDTGGKVITA